MDSQNPHVDCGNSRTDCDNASEKDYYGETQKRGLWQLTNRDRYSEKSRQEVNMELYGK